MFSEEASGRGETEQHRETLLSVKIHLQIITYFSYEKLSKGQEVEQRRRKVQDGKRGGEEEEETRA